jgi:hypothetical protein
MKLTKANTRKRISYETINGTKVSSFETKKGEKFLEVIADPLKHKNAANFIIQLSDESLAAIHACIGFLEPNLGFLNDNFKAYPKTKRRNETQSAGETK